MDQPTWGSTRWGSQIRHKARKRGGRDGGEGQPPDRNLPPMTSGHAEKTRYEESKNNPEHKTNGERSHSIEREGKSDDLRGATLRGLPPSLSGHIQLLSNCLLSSLSWLPDLGRTRCIRQSGNHGEVVPVKGARDVRPLSTDHNLSTE